MKKVTLNKDDLRNLIEFRLINCGCEEEEGQKCAFCQKIEPLLHQSVEQITLSDIEVASIFIEGLSHDEYGRLFNAEELGEPQDFCVDEYAARDGISQTKAKGILILADFLVYDDGFNTTELESIWKTSTFDLLTLTVEALTKVCSEMDGEDEDVLKEFLETLHQKKAFVVIEGSL